MDPYHLSRMYKHSQCQVKGGEADRSKRDSKIGSFYQQFNSIFSINNIKLKTHDDGCRMFQRLKFLF